MYIELMQLNCFATSLWTRVVPGASTNGGEIGSTRVIKAYGYLRYGVIVRNLQMQMTTKSWLQ